MDESKQEAIGNPAELSRERLANGKALCFERIQWRDERGRERFWETVERVSRRPAVLLIPWLRPSNRLVLVRQYRPPAGGKVIEFPAGLADEGEEPGQSGLRELYEETGYRGRIVSLWPGSFNSPGLSGEQVRVIHVEIDEMEPQNARPEPHPDAGECIEVLRIPDGELPDFFERESKAGVLFDSKVAAYVAGFVQSMRLKPEC